MELPLKDLPTPFKWIIGGIFVVAVLFVAIRYIHEARKAGNEADVAALRRQAEEDDLKKKQSPPVPKVSQPDTPASGGLGVKKPGVKGGTVLPVESKQTKPPANVEAEIPSLVSLSAFEEGSLEILEGKHKGKRLPVSSSLRNNFPKAIIGPSGDVRFKHPDGGAKVFDVYFTRESERVVTGNPTCDTFECRWVPVGYPK